MVGFVGARGLRMPAAQIVGPMVVCAAVHLVGVIDTRPPSQVIAFAQVVVGSAIGCRFAGVAVRHVFRTLIVSFGAALLMVSLTMVFAFALIPLGAAEFPALVLAFAPGGLAEMSLIAFALGVDAAFVSTHHIMRIVIVVVVSPTIFRHWAGPKLFLPGGRLRDEAEPTG